MAGALGFEPRMPVPKTSALPLGYAPILFRITQKNKIYIVFEYIAPIIFKFSFKLTFANSQSCFF